MTAKDPAAPGFKEKAEDELKDFLVISAYLTLFFCALATYSMLLLKRYDVNYLNYTFAIINALVIAKVILIGEMAHMGRRFEGRLLYQSVLYKAFVFALLVFAFHIIEEFVKRLIHDKPAGTVLEGVHYDEVIARAIVIFCTFLPLFAFRELRRVLGQGRLFTLFFKPRDGGEGVSAVDKK